MHQYLNVIITNRDGTREIQWQGIAVPGIGDDITVRGEGGDREFGGTVDQVHWEYKTESAGAVVTVWLDK